MRMCPKGQKKTRNWLYQYRNQDKPRKRDAKAEEKESAQGEDESLAHIEVDSQKVVEVSTTQVSASQTPKSGAASTNGQAATLSNKSYRAHPHFDNTVQLVNSLLVTSNPTPQPRELFGDGDIPSGEADYPYSMSLKATPIAFVTLGGQIDFNEGMFQFPNEKAKKELMNVMRSYIFSDRWTSQKRQAFELQDNHQTPQGVQTQVLSDNLVQDQMPVHTTQIQSMGDQVAQAPQVATQQVAIEDAQVATQQVAQPSQVATQQVAQPSQVAQVATQQVAIKDAQVLTMSSPLEEIKVEATYQKECQPEGVLPRNGLTPGSHDEHMTSKTPNPKQSGPIDIEPTQEEVNAAHNLVHCLYLRTPLQGLPPTNVDGPEDSLSELSQGTASITESEDQTTYAQPLRPSLSNRTPRGRGEEGKTVEAVDDTMSSMSSMSCVILSQSVIADNTSRYPIKNIYGKLYGGSESFELQKGRHETPSMPLPNGHFSSTYGEITFTGMRAILKAMNKLSPFTSESVFVDIGCGIGLPVFHAALAYDIHSVGYEVLPNRFKLALDLKTELEVGGYDPKRLNKTHFKRKNIEDVIGLNATHIYSFNPRFSEDNNVDLIRLFELRIQTQAEILVMCLDPTKASKLGLLNAEFVDSLVVSMAGTTQRFKFYIYRRSKTDFQSVAKPISDRLYQDLDKGQFLVVPTGVNAMLNHDFLRLKNSSHLGYQMNYMMNDTIIDCYIELVQASYEMKQVAFIDNKTFKRLQGFLARNEEIPESNMLKKRDHILIPWYLLRGGDLIDNIWVLFYADVLERKLYVVSPLDLKQDAYLVGYQKILKVLNIVTRVKFDSEYYIMANVPTVKNIDSGVLLCNNCFDFSRFRKAKTFCRAQWNDDTAGRLRLKIRCQLYTGDLFFYSKLKKNTQPTPSIDNNESKATSPSTPTVEGKAAKQETAPKNQAVAKVAQPIQAKDNKGQSKVTFHPQAKGTQPGNGNGKKMNANTVKDNKKTKGKDNKKKTQVPTMLPKKRHQKKSQAKKATSQKRTQGSQAKA